MSFNRTTGKSLCIFGPDNRFRKFCWNVTHHRVFSVLLYITIIVSLIPLFYYSPLNDPESVQERNMVIISTVTAVIFLIEALLKIIAQGFLFNYEGSYLRNAWNIIDFLVVLTNVVDLTLVYYGMEQKLVFLKTLKCFMIFRPLRFIGKTKDLRVATESLLSAIPSILKM